MLNLSIKKTVAEELNLKSKTYSKTIKLVHFTESKEKILELIIKSQVV